MYILIRKKALETLNDVCYLFSVLTGIPSYRRNGGARDFGEYINGSRLFLGLSNFVFCDFFALRICILLPVG